ARRPQTPLNPGIMGLSAGGLMSRPPSPIACAPAGARKPVYPPAFFFLAAVLMIALHFIVPIRRVIHAPYRYVRAPLLLTGFVVSRSVAGTFRRAGTTIKPFEESSALLVDGLYHVTRNPIYLAMVVGLVGIGILLGSVTPFLVVPAFAYMIDRRFIRA